MASPIELVGKIGSMALIRREEKDIDYNIFSRLGAELRPGMIWVSSGAVEIGRLDYIKRTGHELTGNPDEVKTDYSAQGQAILMENYRRFIPANISVRQLLVEHTHFNSRATREFIRDMLLRCPEQGAVPIVNYNDTVSCEEHRKMELMQLRDKAQDVVECVDNDETAAVIAGLVEAQNLLILTSADGIYADPKDPSDSCARGLRQGRRRDGAQDPRASEKLRGRVPRGSPRRKGQAGIHSALRQARHHRGHRPRPVPRFPADERRGALHPLLYPVKHGQQKGGSTDD